MYYYYILIYIESFKSVTIENMSIAFGVSQSFIDKELSHFISSDRINAKIDKVSGIIECVQDEPIVSLYHKSVTESDILLNKIHKLSKYLESK